MMKSETKLEIKNAIYVYFKIVLFILALLSMLSIIWGFVYFISPIVMEHRLENARIEKQIQELQIQELQIKD